MATPVTALMLEARMHSAIEISLYPLDANYIASIKAFIDRLSAYPDIKVLTNAMSTQVSGEHQRLFEILAKETAITFGETGRKVFVMKLLGGETGPSTSSARTDASGV
jgi:uncharacterized protein YqgV (UPF0045/DUF77 family)